METTQHGGKGRRHHASNALVLVALAWATAVACGSETDTSEPDTTDGGAEAAVGPQGTGGTPAAGGAPAAAGSPGAMGGSGGQNCLECHDVAWLEEQGIPPSMYE